MGFRFGPRQPKACEHTRQADKKGGHEACQACWWGGRGSTGTGKRGRTDSIRSSKRTGEQIH